MTTCNTDNMILLHARVFDCREEAQAEKREYIELVDSTVRTIIKEEVNAQLPQILPQAISNVATPVIKKNVTEYLEVAVLTRGVEMTETKIETPPMDQTEGRKEGNQVKRLCLPEIQGQRKRSLQAPLKTPLNLNISLPASLPMQKNQVILSKDSGMQQDQVFITRDNDEQPVDKDVTKADWFKKPERPPTTDPDWSKRQHVDFRSPQTWISQVARTEEPPTSFDELNDTSFDFSAFVMNRLKIPNLTKEILGGDLSRRYSTSMTKTKAATYELKWIEDLVPELWSPVQRRIIAITRLKIMKKYAYGHLEEIEVRRDDQKLYMFKEVDFKRLRLQDIEDMLLLLAQQKLTNLTIDERYDLNVAL
ncbi:hypothetical protein Tco_0947223, partial [Tanacetum coccineum]